MAVKFGPLLKRFRQHAGYGLRQFAEMVGDAPSNYAGVEAGNRAPWRAQEKLRRVAEALGLDERSPEWDTFFLCAGKNTAIPPDLEHVLAKPGVPMFLRTVDELRLTEDDLRKLAESLRRKKARAKRK